MRRHFTLLLCFMILLGTISSVHPGAVGACSHLMPGYAAENTGLAPETCEPSSIDGLDIKWKIDSHATFTYKPVIVEDKIYSVGTDSMVCIDIASGQTLMENEEDAPWSSEISPVSDGKKLYFYHSGHTGMLDSAPSGISCIDLSDLRLIWTKAVNDINASSLVLAGDKLIMTDLLGKVVCCDSATGETLWKFKTEGRILSSVAVGLGKVVVGSEDSILYCLDIKDGRESWTFQTGKEITATPTIANGNVYFGATDTNFYCLDIKTGKKVWVYKGDKYPIKESAATNGKLIVYSCSPGPVICLDAATGAKKWEFLTYKSSFHGKPTICKDKVYIASDTKMFILNLGNGSKLVEFNAADKGGAGNIAIPHKQGILLHIGREFKLLSANKGTKSFINSVEISPSIGKMYVDQKIQLKARGFDSNRKFVEIVKPEWTIENPKTATISQDGTLTAINEGNATVNIKYKNYTDSMSIRVLAAKPRKQVVTYIEITPDPEENVFEFAFGEKVQFKAKPLDEFREEVEWAKITWEVEYPKTCTIDETGLFTVNYGTRDSSGTILCSSDNVDVRIRFTIKDTDPEDKDVKKIVIEPENGWVKPNGTIQFKALCYNKSNQQIKNVIGATWLTPDYKYGEIDRETGLYKAKDLEGVVSVTITIGSVDARTNLTISSKAPTPPKPPTPPKTVTVNKLVVSPTSFPSVMVDEFRDIYAKALDASGKDMLNVPIKMSSDNEKIAVAYEEGSISKGRNGMMYGKSPGKCNIIVTAADKTFKIPVTVIPKPPTAKIVVNMTKVVIEKGREFEILATGYDKNGKVIPSTFTWTTSNSKMSKSGEHQKGASFYSLEKLKGTITVKADKVSVTINVEIVENVTAVKIAVKPTSLKIQMGKSAEIAFTAYDKNNKPIIGKSFFVQVPHDALKQENLITKAKITALNKTGKFTATVICGNLSQKVSVEIIK